MREYAFSAIPSSAEHLTFDVVIVGSGLAGLYAALNLDQAKSCALINKAGFEESNSMYAQGGIASVVTEIDSFQSHISDTLIAGAGLCNEEAVSVLVHEGPDDIKKLIDYGVPFDRDANGNYIVSMEGAHSFNRIMHCNGDATGYNATKTLVENVKKQSNITCFENMMLVDILLGDDHAVSGVVLQDDQNNYFVIQSPSVILATGGIGGLYRKSTNSSVAKGDGIAAAWRAGAALENMEFVQFHPTALIHPDLNNRYFLISEALRGEGAVLRNRKWEPFMKDVHPMADLAPRDIVSRAIVREMEKYDLPNVYLDITFKPREVLSKRFPMIYHECMKRGIDIASDWIPVIPVQHYFMGGIKTDLNGKTNISGLYACGESACTGVHGANRLASNSLLECLVFGRRCAQDVNGASRKRSDNANLTIDVKKEAKTLDFETIRSNIRYTMTKKGGIVRSMKGLKEASTEIEAYYEQLRRTALRNVSEKEKLNIATVSLQILLAAQKRKESVGAHYIKTESEI